MVSALFVCSADENGMTVLLHISVLLLLLALLSVLPLKLALSACEPFTTYYLDAVDGKVA